MEIRPAIKVLHGSPVREYYVVEVKDDTVLLMRTDSAVYNDASFHHVDSNGKYKPFFPFWTHIREIYVSGKHFVKGGESDC